MDTILFATDLDKTLVGDDSSLRQLNDSIARLRGESAIKLVYVTARSRASFDVLMAATDLLQPDALITSLGTEIYVDNMSTPMADWPRPRQWNAQSIRDVLRPVAGLSDQPMAEQNQHKVSYYIDAPTTFDAVRQALGEASVEAMYSGTRYLDILPAGVHKASAVGYVAAMWGIDHDHVITAGDSPNDSAMLAEYRSIIVGNAQQLLLDWVRAQDQSTIYVARATYAAGIIEGLKHYHVIA
jgi:sucrose-6-phosphatase